MLRLNFNQIHSSVSVDGVGCNNNNNNDNNNNNNKTDVTPISNAVARFSLGKETWSCFHKNTTLKSTPHICTSFGLQRVSRTESEYAIAVDVVVMCTGNPHSRSCPGETELVKQACTTKGKTWSFPTSQLTRSARPLPRGLSLLSPSPPHRPCLGRERSQTERGCRGLEEHFFRLPWTCLGKAESYVCRLGLRPPL